MRRLSVIAIIGALALTSGASADDAPAVPVATAAQLPMYDSPKFDWNGFYAGVYGTGTLTPTHGLEYGYGVDVGFTHAFEYVLIGGEVAFHPLGNDTIGTTYLQAIGRGGVIVGDHLLAYAAAGYGSDLGAANGPNVLAGGGLEYGVTEDVSLRAQYLHGFAVSGSAPIEQFTLGAQFHF